MKKPFSGSFSEAVKFLLDFRQRNEALTKKNGWSTDPEDVANFVDEYNAQRMVAAGYFGFVELEGDPPSRTGGASRSGPGVVAAAVSGLAIYREMFSGSSQPVAKDEAERRATVCVACPLNKLGGLREWFVEHVAKGITELYGMMRDLDLTTSRDQELGTCTACLCPTRAKIFVEMATILRHTKPNVLAKLDDRCWILSGAKEKGA